MCRPWRRMHHTFWSNYIFIRALDLFEFTYTMDFSEIVSAISENSGVFGEGSSCVYSVPNSNLIYAVASVCDSAELTLPSTFEKKLDRISAIWSLQIWLLMISSSSCGGWQVWLLVRDSEVSFDCWIGVSFYKSLTTASCPSSSLLLLLKFESVFDSDAFTSSPVWSRQTGRSLTPDLSLEDREALAISFSSLFPVASSY